MTSQQFDEYAQSYDDDIQRAIDFCGQELEYFTRRKVEELLDITRRHIGDPAGVSMLDVGCGIGQTDALLAPHVRELHGVDLASEAVERARRRQIRPSDTRRTTARRCHTPDETFDVAFAICVMHHVDVEQRPAFTAEMRRVVRAGGLAVVFEHNPYNPLTRHVVRNCEFDEGVVLLNRRTVQRFLADAGLRAIEKRFVIFAPFDRAWVPGVERRLGWMPAGAQHYVAARR